MPLLERLTAAGDKEHRRAVRRAFYRLEQSGVRPARAAAGAPVRPVVTREAEHPVRAWLSGIDGSGSRAAWILFEGGLGGGLRLCSLILNDEAGIMDAAGGPIARKRLEAELRRLRESQKLPWVEVDGGRACALVADALALHERLGTVPPPEFARWKRVFAAAARPPQSEPAAAPPRPELLERSPSLLDLPELMGWFVDPGRVQHEALALLQARESRLVVSEQIKAEREAAILDGAIETHVPAYRAPAAWVVALELSPSMDAADVPPSRIARARYAIDDLLSASHDARVGLVAFAGDAYTVAPLTSDVATVRNLAQPLTPSLMPEPGDRLAPALEESARLLQASAGRDRQVIVFTDGFTDPAVALVTARELRQQGITVSVVGIGTASGAPEPNGNGGFARDAQGQVALTRLDTGLLGQLAAAGGGHYVPQSGLPALIAELHGAGSRSMSSGVAAPDVRLASWLNDGVWLLPPLLLLAALVARRGWL
ncbi:MAG TPA: VWA domain-containing protein [Methylomirabilota bacterium]|nr:VWA domain-containing protein [Methylomirabilota bacterium]